MADRQCVLCNEFVTSDYKLMKRHVAIIHGDSPFSTLQCEICKRKYYDFDHFQEHIKETPSCSSDCLMMMKQITLANYVEKAFHSLVDELMKPVHIQSAQFPLNAALSCGRVQMDVQHQECEDSVDQEKVDENLASMSDAQMDHGTEEIGDVQSIIKENNGHGELQQKPSEVDLRLHCRKIILKCRRDNRLTCSICKGSIVAVSKEGFPHCYHTMEHAKRHVSSLLFACNLCDFKSNHRDVMRRHVTGKHSSDQYIDTTADRIDELMQLVTQCFDSGLYAGNPISLQLPSQSSSQLCSPSVKEPLADFIVACTNESPKIISVRSLADQGHFVDQTITVQDASMDSAEQIDVQHKDQHSVDQGKLPENRGSMFDAQMEGVRMDNGTEDVDSVQSIIKESNVNLEELQRKRSLADLRLHCRKIILKRQQNGPLTCSVCKGSIMAVKNIFSKQPQVVLNHALRHASKPIFACNFCSQKSNNDWSMRSHVDRKHSSDQYIDTTADRIDELKQLVTRCFDHGLHAGNSLVASRISERQQEIANSGTPDQDMSNGDYGSEAQVSTMVGVLKLPINVHKGTGCRNSNGQPRKSRYTTGRTKQDGFSVTLEKNNLGTRLSAASDSGLSKLLPEPVSHELNDQGIKQSLKLPPHILGQKEICSELARKFIKDGKLECKLCQHLIKMPKRQHSASKLVNMQNAYFHAMAHIHDVHLFECTTCDYRTSSQTATYFHVAHTHNTDQWTFIDHRAKYYQKILKIFLACYTDEKSVPLASSEGHLNERTVARKIERKNPKIPHHILKARRACYNRVKAFIKNDKLYCQLCPQWVVVAYPTRNNIGYVMNMAIKHATTHVEGCHVFECSTCHIVTKSMASMNRHTRKYHKGGQAKVLDRSHQYYREIFSQFLACFDVESSGEKLEELEMETTTSIATEQGTSVASGGFEKTDKMGRNGRSALEPKDSAQDQDIKSVCSKCGYKTGFQLLFRRHQKIMHAE